MRDKAATNSRRISPYPRLALSEREKECDGGVIHINKPERSRHKGTNESLRVPRHVLRGECESQTSRLRFGHW